jgi:hypothetical protein
MPDFSQPSDEQFALVDRLFEELMVKHFEMAQMVEQYRELVESLQTSSWDVERRRLAGALPGARYHVAMTFAQNQGLRIEAELKKMFPRE